MSKQWIIAAVMVVVLAAGMVAIRMKHTYVNGYTRTNGTYVAGYWKSKPDGVTWNNLETWGVSIRGQ